MTDAIAAAGPDENLTGSANPPTFASGPPARRWHSRQLPTWANVLCLTALGLMLTYIGYMAGQGWRVTAGPAPAIRQELSAVDPVRRSEALLLYSRNGVVEADCSGSVGLDNLVLTAAHCLPKPGQLVTVSLRAAASARHLVRPFGQCSAQMAWRAPDRRDLAVLRVTSCPVTADNPTGSTDLAALTGAPLWQSVQLRVGEQMTVAGYPHLDPLGGLYGATAPVVALRCGASWSWLCLSGPKDAELAVGAVGGDSGGMIAVAADGQDHPVGALSQGLSSGRRTTYALLSAADLTALQAMTG